jgi:hypothetical protein
VAWSRLGSSYAPAGLSAADVPAVPVEEALRLRDERRLRALGIARARGPGRPVEPADVGEAGEPAVVEGVRGTWRVDPARSGEPAPHGRFPSIMINPEIIPPAQPT